MFLISLIIVIASIYYMAILIYNLNDDAYKQAFINKIEEYKLFGLFMFIIITSLQVVFAFIPGEIMEIIAGLLYGPFFGLIVISVGVTIGCVIVYYLVKKIGINFFNKFFDINKYQNKFQLLGCEKRLEILIFSITLIPGLPKDFIAFIIPFTKVKLHRFLVINVVARIPSILSSTLIGASLINGKYDVGIIIFSISTVIALIGIIFNKKIEKFIILKTKDKE